MTSKKWIKIALLIFVISSLTIMALVAVIDPFFHFHKPLNSIQYSMLDERYENDGIARHFDYEIMITGTSMSQNFRPSYFEKLWGKKTIKTAFSGATFHELCESMERAIGYNKNLKIIVCSLDPNMMCAPFDSYAYDSYPTYLYDKNPFNDISYLLNKDVIVKCLSTVNYTRAGNVTTSMDEYGRFDTYLPTGKDAVLSTFERMDRADLSKEFSEEDEEVIRENLEKNYLKLADRYPEVYFIFYIPPYSAYYWDALERTSQLEYSLAVINYTIEHLNTRDNISIYSFENWEEVMFNPDLYMDTLHYTGDVCDRITEALFKGENRLYKGARFGENIKEITEEKYNTLFEN